MAKRNPLFFYIVMVVIYRTHLKKILADGNALRHTVRKDFFYGDPIVLTSRPGE